MARVLFTCPMDEERREALEALAPGAFEARILEDVPPEERDAVWSEADVIVCIGFPSEIPEDLGTRAPQLRMLQTLVAGVDHLPFPRIPPSVIICSNAGAYNTSVAEHAMALLLAAAKDVPRATEEIRSGVFRQDRVNRALAGSILVIAGMGGIGREVARLAKAFGMHVIGLTRDGRTVLPADEGGALRELPSLASRADALIVTLPLTRETRGLIDRRVLQGMKEDAILVNVARGRIIHEDDLYEHLRAHPRFHAALDVWWTYPKGECGRPFHRPFHELPNVVMTPHVAFSVPGQRRRAMEAALGNVLRLLRGETPRNLVDRTEYEEEGSSRPHPI